MLFCPAPGSLPFPPVFPGLDEALGGGLYPGLYMMGAISSLGKTTLACQIADQIAAAGQPVLIFSLEMARKEIFAKSISRLSVVCKMIGESKATLTAPGFAERIRCIGGDSRIG